MPLVKVWIHLIWSTKNRDKLISTDLKQKLLSHIKENAKAKDIYVDCVNCVSDHIHLLFSLKSEQSISKIAMLIKGESSFWVNKNNLSRFKFEWQDEFIAVSVSESAIPRVRDYIKNQDEHHRKISFEEEYKQFLEKFGFNKFAG
jgi:REP element-mobilizing transposase RayT